MAKHAAQRRHQGASRRTAGDDGRHTIQRTHITPHILISYSPYGTAYFLCTLHQFNGIFTTACSPTGPTVSATNPSLVLFSPRDLRNCLLAATSPSPHTSHIHRTLLVSSPPPFLNTSSLPAPVIKCPGGLLIPSPSALALCSTLVHFSLHHP